METSVWYKLNFVHSGPPDELDFLPPTPFQVCLLKAFNAIQQADSTKALESFSGCVGTAITEVQAIMS